jgi:hypothetical protein
MVGCTATQSDARQPPPVRNQEIVLVLDVSGSMECGLGSGHSALGGSSRIDLVRNSCEWLLQNLPRENTSVGVVSFSSRAHTVHPLKPLDTHLDSLLGSITGLKSGGGTNMWEGMQMGSSLLLNNEESHQSQSSKIMIVLSDGDVNEGRQDIQTAVAEVNDYTQIELWMFAVSSSANTTLCEAAVRSCGGTLIAISDPEAVPAAFGSFCGAERLLEQVSVTLVPNGATEFSVISISAQDRSKSANQAQVSLGFLMQDLPRYVLFRARVRLPDVLPSSGVVQIGSLSTWCLAASGDLSVELPLMIKLSSSADDGAVNLLVAKTVQKEEMARAMRSGNVGQMRALAEKLRTSSLAADFAADIAILLQLAKDFEDRSEDAQMNSIQMAQECSNNRSMQSAPRFTMSKAAMCSPSIVHKSKSAFDQVSAKMKGATASSFPASSTPATVASQKQHGAPVKLAPPAQNDSAPDSGVAASLLSGLRSFTSSIFGASSSNPDME